ncbi:MAG TPA: hypothetical protein VMY59_06555 [Candidatus Thermoplasmatota archaeon]|nr:hypothetical protein [Candidatus Thermoplasmatota archaeon]
MEYDNLKKLALYNKNIPLPGDTLPNFHYQNKFKIDAPSVPG